MHQRSIFPRNINAKMWLPISSIGVCFLAAACTPKVSFQSTRWSGSGERPQISAENSEVVSKPTWKSLSEDVQLSEQTVAGFPVDESFVKTIRKNDEYIFQSAGIVPKMSTRLIERAKSLNAQKTEIWQSFLKTHREFQNWPIESQPRVLFMRSQSFQPVIQAVLSSPNGEFFAVSLRENGELISSIQQGSNLTTTLDIQALAFPEGPRRSSLAKIFLSRLNQAEGLANGRIEVATQSPVKILSDQDLEVPPPDDRFDQVQAYFFSNQILNWFEKKLSLKGPFKVSILTHVGYPEKTNTAFYYQNKIRLGAGDDVFFSRIPWDPTIVMHETSHAVIDALTRLPFQGEGGSLNEGFADFFTTFFLQSPLLGDSSYKKADYKRSVDKALKLSEKNGGLYHDSVIVSGFFWSLRKIIGDEKSLFLGVKVLNRLGPSSDFEDFSLALKEQAQESLKEDDLTKTLNLMRDRELL